MTQIERLLGIMRRLRDPENGCPWDKEQTFATIAPYTLEETYEVLDAIAREDFDDLRGELGDLLFQVVFYAQMAQEEGRFDFNDICAAISDKLERRHPHIFGEASAGSSSEVLARWEQIKSAERAEKSQHSALDDIPHSLPALMRAHKIQKRCSAVGFDWTSLGPVLDKVHEEIDEVMHEAQQAVVDEAKLEEEVGDLLFQVVFYAQMAQEEGRFDFNDICAAIGDKLERRHPHIFGDASAGNSSEVLARWEQIKSAERAEKSQHSALDDIPHSLPALMRAHKIQKRCSAVGFDWTSLGPVLDKVHEEIDEVMHEAQQAVVDEAKLEEEVGDLLFATVNLSRHLGVKAEVALQKANLKFERRFREVERIVAARGLEMTGVDLDTMELVWQEVKRQETDL